MNLESLPHLVMSKITDFLDPESRILFLNTVKDFHRERETGKKPRYHCFFCVTSIWFHDMPLGQYTGPGEDFCYILRAKQTYSELRRGAHDRKLYDVNYYQRRHYEDKNEELEITQLFHYFGNELFTIFKVIFGLRILIRNFR